MGWNLFLKKEWVHQFMARSTRRQDASGADDLTMEACRGGGRMAHTEEGFNLMMMGVIFTSFDDCILGALMEANAVAKKTQHPGGHESGNLTGGWSMAQQRLTETNLATI
ncbi:hypothetical protein WN944_023871 [Citrus x changshan-huyou]|uniref:Uncharacterized protein n=1 Tax=Citrus x changshan-huyou TaxID=2935761 RepID=A0AAP0LMN0_9ROSI